MSYRYQNISDYDQELMGFATVKQGEEFETDKIVNNPNFKYLGEGTAAVTQTETAPAPIVGIAPLQDNVVTEATLQEDNKEGTK